LDSRKAGIFVKDNSVYFNSITLAMKAKRLLSRSGVEAEIIKRGQGGDNGGCVYGLSYKLSSEFTVISILKNSNIPYHFKKV
jgi:hypothetical protein